MYISVTMGSCIWASHMYICIYQCGYLCMGVWQVYICYISVWVPVYGRLTSIYVYISEGTCIWASHRCVTVGGTCSMPLYTLRYNSRVYPLKQAASWPGLKEPQCLPHHPRPGSPLC